jgi:hypothetical protein
MLLPQGGVREQSLEPVAAAKSDVAGIYGMCTVMLLSTLALAIAVVGSASKKRWRTATRTVTPA